MHSKYVGVRIPENVYKYVSERAVDEHRTLSNMIISILFDSSKQKKGKWERMSEFPEDEDDRYQCSICGNIVHYQSKLNLYTFNSWCGKCGSNNNPLFPR